MSFTKFRRLHKYNCCSTCNVCSLEWDNCPVIKGKLKQWRKCLVQEENKEIEFGKEILSKMCYKLY